jgi:hypothetical protein
MNEPNLTELAREWLRAKAREAAANKERIAIEERMLPFLEKKDEGSRTTETPDGWKISCTQKMTRKLDLDAYDRVAIKIPINMRPIKVTRSLDEKGAKWLADNEPDIFAILAPCITTTPAKPSIAVARPIEEEAAA